MITSVVRHVARDVNRLDSKPSHRLSGASRKDSLSKRRSSGAAESGMRAPLLGHRLQAHAPAALEVECVTTKPRSGSVISAASARSRKVRARAPGTDAAHGHRRGQRGVVGKCVHEGAAGVIDFPVKNDGGGLDRTADLGIVSGIECDPETHD